MDSLKDAVGAFSRGEMFFEDLCAVVAQIPPSPAIVNAPPVGNESLGDLYLRSERQYAQMPAPNSLSWFAMLRAFGDIDDEQYAKLLRVAGQFA